MKSLMLLDGTVEEVTFGTVMYVPPKGKYKKPFALVCADGDADSKYRIPFNLRPRFVQTGDEHPELVEKFGFKRAQEGDVIFFIADKDWVLCWGSKEYFEKSAREIAEQRTTPIASDAQLTAEPVAVAEWSPGIGTLQEEGELTPPTLEEADRMIKALTPGAGKSMPRQIVKSGRKFYC